MYGKEKIMSNYVKNELSKRNKYYISKDRYLELKHFCLQYKEWRDEYNAIDNYPSRNIEILSNYAGISKDSFVEKQAIKAAELSKRMKLVKDVAKATDEYLGDYIFKAVTEDLSFTYLSTKLSIPCGRDMYYDRYRRFFWLMDKER